MLHGTLMLTCAGTCVQHAVVAWLREHADLCEVIHGHEWGGVLVDAATVAYFRRLPPGTRTVIVPHGGHMWSLQWKPQRSLSVEPLRIDHQVCSSNPGLASQIFAFGNCHDITEVPLACPLMGSCRHSNSFIPEFHHQPSCTQNKTSVLV